MRGTIGGILRTKLRRAAREFLAATTDCRATQQDVLNRLLQLNGESRFHCDHGLREVHTPADLALRLPVTSYELYRPYIDEMKQGDPSALLGSNNRLLMFCLSSGTTADSKFIPVTKPFLDDYRRGWQIWGIRAFDDHPGANTKNIVQLASDHDRFRTPGKTACGNISGLATASQTRIVRSMYTIPYAVSKIEDADARYYTALRLAVADDNVGMVTTANPSTLVHMAQMAEAVQDELIRDIADGKLSQRFEIAADIRRKLHPRIGRRRPQRARQLQQIATATGRFLPQDYWPGIEFLAVWTGGSCAAYLEQMREFFGDVPTRDHGLSASEGRMTIPLYDNRSEGVLDVTTHFFEFIPEQEYGRKNPTVLQAHELQADENYYILLTTSSGFFRYDICDVVRCVDYCGSTPVLKFLHKGSHIASITGEKVSESQVVDAVRGCHRKIRQFTVTPAWGDPPYYRLLVEARDLESPDVGQGLVANVDQRLQELNCEYREKRLSGRLAPMKCVCLPDGAWNRFARHRQSSLGGSVEQYKHPCLIPDLEFSARFLTEVSAEPVANVPNSDIPESFTAH